MSSKEWTNVKTILRGMFRFAYKNQIIETNLMDDVEITVKFRQVSKKSGRTETYNTDELRDLNKIVGKNGSPGVSIDAVREILGHSNLRTTLGYIYNSDTENELLFPTTERAVQKHLKTVCCYLGISGVSTHSFRKYGATEIYKNNGYDIALVQRLLQHSSVSVSQAYIGIEPQRIEEAILGHTQLL